MRLIDTNGDGRYDQQQVVAGGLAAVHSVAFVNGQLLAAAEDRLVRLANFDANGTAQQVDQLLALPGGATDLYGHRTRTLAPGPDGKLYLSVGSSCDVCEESTPQRAAILRLNSDGSGVEVFASGLRNTVGFDWRPFTGELWGSDMGRNNIGEGLPPDELNLIEQGKNYGWPYCHSARVPNPEYNDPARCANTEAPRFDFPSHWAPLGTLFYGGLNFPPPTRAICWWPSTAPPPIKVQEPERLQRRAGALQGRPAGGDGGSGARLERERRCLGPPRRSAVLARWQPADLRRLRRADLPAALYGRAG